MPHRSVLHVSKPHFTSHSPPQTNKKITPQRKKPAPTLTYSLTHIHPTNPPRGNLNLGIQCLATPHTTVAHASKPSTARDPPPPQRTAAPRLAASIPQRRQIRVASLPFGTVRGPLEVDTRRDQQRGDSRKQKAGNESFGRTTKPQKSRRPE